MRYLIFFFILNIFSVNSTSHAQEFNIVVPEQSISASAVSGNVYYYYLTLPVDGGTSPLFVPKRIGLLYYGDISTVELIVGTLSISGSPDFTLQNNQCDGVNIPGAQRCYFDVVFLPTIEGTQTATVTIPYTNKIPNPQTGLLDTTIGALYVVITAATENTPELPELDTDNSCLIAANSYINIDSQSLEEKIPLVGIDFDIHYSSSRHRQNSKFNPTFLGLGGWTVSGLHHYDTTNSIIFLGDGSLRNVTAKIESGKNIVASKDGQLVYEFDANGRHLLTKDARTNIKLQEFSYDSSGRILSVTDQFGKKTLFQYLAGETRVRSPYNLVNKLRYDENGFLAEVENPKKEKHLITNNSTGLLLKFKKPMGQESIVTYDNKERVVLDQGAGGDLVRVLSQFSNNKQQNTKSSALNVPVVYETFGDANASTHNVYGSGGETSTSVFTKNGTNSFSNNYGESSQSVQAQDPRFEWMSPFASQYSYNVANSPIAIQKSSQRIAENHNATTYSSFTKLIETEQEQNDPKRVYTKTFLANKRTEVFKTPRGRFTKQIFDDKNMISNLEVRGLTPINFQYDSLGKLTEIIQGSRTITRTYDKFGFLSSIKDAQGQTTLYNHDRAGRLVRKTLPDGRAILFGYDQNGNLTKVKPPGKKEHLFQYDLMDLVSDYLPPALSGITDPITRYDYNLDRQISRIEKPGGDAINFTYNPQSGLLENINTPLGKYRYSFINNSKLLNHISSPDNIDLNYSYYGSFLRKVQTQGAVQNELEYLYSSDARISGLIVSDGTNSKQIDFKYDSDGVLIRAGKMGMRRGNFREVTFTKIGNITGDHTYNSFGESLTDSYAALTQALFSRNYSRDNVGRITAVSENGQQTNSKRIQYIYDLQGRLTDVRQNGQTVRNYVYDSNGNRLQKKLGSTTITSRFDAQDRLIKLGKVSYEYNTNGDLTKSIDGTKITSYQYDVFGNLKSVTLPNQSQISYIIDGQNRRIGKKLNNQLIQSFIYQSQTQIAAEMDGQNRIVKRFIYGEKSNIPDYMIFQNKNYRIISDQVGTPRMLVEVRTGQIVAQYDYDEFGVLLSKSGSIDLPFGFAGGLKDDDTGLVRFGARDYNPIMGRWTAKDPILFNGGDANLYGYVLNDPVNLIDPDGKLPVLVLAPLLGGIVGGATGIITTALNGGSRGDIINAGITGAIGGAIGGLGLATGLGAAASIGAGTAASLLTALPDSGVNPSDVGTGLKQILNPQVNRCSQ